MRPAVSRICEVAARACSTMCLHLGSSRQNCSYLLCWSLRITTLDKSLLWSLYWQFACSVWLCGSLLWLPILPILRPALPTPHKKWFMVGIGSGKFLHWSSFNVMVLVGGRLQGWFPLTGLPWNLPDVPGICAGPPTNFGWHQFPSLSIGDEFNKC